MLGSPIAHSKSPALHAAAYRVLGLDWQYEAIDVTSDSLDGFVESRDESWRGLSLTMPLKRDVLALLDTRDEVVDLAGGANTVVFDDSGDSRRICGFNTDVYGIQQAFVHHGIDALDSVHILGGGATAASALVAAHGLGVTRAVISVRTPLKALTLAQLGESLGIETTVRDLRVSEETQKAPDAVISTLPGGASTEVVFAEKVRSRSVLFDVAYDPWPSSLALAWQEAGGTIVPGIDMLLHQAIAQIRIFVSGNPDASLPSEPAVLDAMRAAVGR